MPNSGPDNEDTRRADEAWEALNPLPEPPNNRDQLGKYQIVREIGRGGMGTVYEGFDPLLHRQVAIKVLAPHLTWEREFVSRFLREAQTVANMNHPGIVKIYDIGQEEGRYYFVMEFLAGTSLRDFIQQRGVIPLAETLGVLRQLAAALDYAHAQGVIHRDVKPANVIVAPDGKTTLTDFGIVKAADQTRLTMTGATLGTPEYVSPEQAAQGDVSPATDRYALGVVAYEMLTGRVPFRAPTTMALFYQIVHDPPPPLRQWRPDLAGPAEQVLSLALAKDPRARFSTCAAFVNALDQALRGRPVAERHAPTPLPQAVQAEPPGTRFSRRGRPAWVWAILGVVGTLLAGAAILFALNIAPSGGATTAPTMRAHQPTLTRSPDALDRESSPDVILSRSTPMATGTAAPSAEPPPTARPTLPPPTATALPERLWLGNAGVSASSSAASFQDACGNSTHYDPGQALDGDVATTWRSAENQVDGQWLEIDLGRMVSVERIGISPGFNKVDPCDGTARCRQNRRLHEILLVFSDGTRLAQSFPDTGCDMMYISTRGITASWLRIEVLSTYPPETVNGKPPRNFVAISEVEVVGCGR